MPEPYVLTKLARQELDEILAYIAERDLDTAVRVDQEFDHAFLRLAQNPGIGHVRRDLPRRYRVWHLYDYLIVYKPETAPLEIVRLWHGARRPPRF